MQKAFRRWLDTPSIIWEYVWIPRDICQSPSSGFFAPEIVTRQLNNLIIWFLISLPKFMTGPSVKRILCLPFSKAKTNIFITFSGGFSWRLLDDSDASIELNVFLCVALSGRHRWTHRWKWLGHQRKADWIPSDLGVGWVGRLGFFGGAIWAYFQGRKC